MGRGQPRLDQRTPTVPGTRFAPLSCPPLGLWLASSPGMASLVCHAPAAALPPCPRALEVAFYEGGGQSLRSTRRVLLHPRQPPERPGFQNPRQQELQIPQREDPVHLPGSWDHPRPGAHGPGRSVMDIPARPWHLWLLQAWM